MKAKSLPPQTPTARPAAAQPTFIEHVGELRRRLFWVIGSVVLGATAAFPLQGLIMGLLTAPLAGQKLYYITPVGGFSFIVKVCTYAGLAIAVPVIVYHLYRFLEPVMPAAKKRVLPVALASCALALAGGLFAYFVSLPAALSFLTGINAGNVQAMLTVDSYLSFVMAYLLGAAVLFQIPLVLLIINGITPLPPRRLLSFLRYVVVGAFIVAAIISPTPDVINQSILAAPVILMYLAGVGLVWAVSKRQGPSAKTVPERPAPASKTPAAAVPANVSIASKQPRLAARSIEGIIARRV